MADVVLVVGRACSGLLAGVFVAFAIGVMPALRAVDDHTFVAVMNRINVVIVNPAFLLVFFGAPLLTAGLLGWDRAPWAVAAATLAVLTLGITIVGNIPLNNALAGGGARAGFETPWTVWNAARKVTATASFVCLLRV